MTNPVLEAARLGTEITTHAWELPSDGMLARKGAVCRSVFADGVSSPEIAVLRNRPLEGNSGFRCIYELHIQRRDLLPDSERITLGTSPKRGSQSSPFIP